MTALAPIKDRLSRFADLLDGAADDESIARLRAAESIGRPLGGDRFITRLKRLTGHPSNRPNAGQSPSASTMNN